MKPAQAPRRDLRPSTAIWLLLTGIGAVLVLVALLNELDYRGAALAVGVVQVAIGYAWIVRQTYLRQPLRGLACAVPPATFFYLARRKYAGFRPLRFVVTGAALAGLAFAAPQLADLVRPLVGAREPKPAPDPAAESRLARLRAYREQRDYTALIKLLEELAKTDPTRSVDAADRPELSAELKALCGNKLTDVRLAAMHAYTLWDAEPGAAGARAVCLAAIRSPTQEERTRALRLLPRWKDAESARAVRSLIGPGRRRDEPGQGVARRDRRRAGRAGRAGPAQAGRRPGDAARRHRDPGEGRRPRGGERAAHLRDEDRRAAGAPPGAGRRRSRRSPHAQAVKRKSVHRRDRRDRRGNQRV